MQIPEFEILSSDYVEHPERHYASWLAQGSATALPFRIACVTRYSEARRVYTDRENFSSDAVWTFFDAVNGTEGGPLGIPLVSLDDPDHSRLRNILRPAFERSRSVAFEEKLREKARREIDRLAQNEEVEVASELIAPYIFGAMFDFFGLARPVPVEELTAWSEAIRAPFPLLSSAEREAALAAQSDTVSCLRECLYSPMLEQGSLLKVIQDAVSAGQCSEEEAISLGRFLFYAGNQTTRLCLASVLKVLAQRPALLDELRENRALLNGFLHECLRLEPPTQISLRSARREIEIMGQPLARGDFLFVHNGCANRDPAVFERPDDLIPDRANLTAHLAFGYGFHRCLGLEIALKEMTCLLAELLKRVRSLSLAAGNSFQYRPKMFLRGPEYLRLSIRWQ